MKTLFKILTVITVLGFVSCTNNDKIATRDGRVITTDISTIEKGDTKGPGVGDDEDEDMGEE